jgi:hypothetical protein
MKIIFQIMDIMLHHDLVKKCYNGTQRMWFLKKNYSSINSNTVSYRIGWHITSFEKNIIFIFCWTFKFIYIIWNTFQEITNTFQLSLIILLVLIYYMYWNIILFFFIPPQILIGILNIIENSTKTKKFLVFLPY